MADANIVGKFVDSAGSPMQNLDAEVFASGAGFRRTALGASGTFTLRVVRGTWSLGGELGATAAITYTLQPPVNNRVTVASGDTAILEPAQYFVVLAASGTISGTVYAPDGTTKVAGAWVEALDIPTTAGAAPRPIAGTKSDENGRYSLRVPPGRYQVRASVAREAGEVVYMPPEPGRALITGSETVTVDLRFRSAPATIAGTVTGTGAGTAFVTGYSDKGGWSSTNAGSDGTYSLKVTRDDTWHVYATSRSAGKLYKSSELTVTVGAADTSITGKDLALQEVAAVSLPDGSSVSFDATEMRVLALSDGTKVTIPGSALAISGTVSVLALPKTDLPAQQSAKPISIGYALQARDSNNTEIKKFLQKVTILMPYPADDVLKQMGIDEDSLVPSYWDATSSSWRKAENVIQDKTNNTLTVLVDHFTDFAICSTTGAAGVVPPGGYKTYLPFITKAYAGGW
ncbi:MAG: carboxypeptidase-like regulatory domain-containing protein [Chloroflexi bacterium]|nr:carboxypeptidase-like regulatory domain-containing protein [Chloroflexota bacterium]